MNEVDPFGAQSAQGTSAQGPYGIETPPTTVNPEPTSQQVQQIISYIDGMGLNSRSNPPSNYLVVPFDSNESANEEEALIGNLAAWSVWVKDPSVLGHTNSGFADAPDKSPNGGGSDGSNLTPEQAKKLLESAGYIIYTGFNPGGKVTSYGIEETSTGKLIVSYTLNDGVWGNDLTGNTNNGSCSFETATKVLGYTSIATDTADVALKYAPSAKQALPAVFKAGLKFAPPIVAAVSTGFDLYGVATKKESWGEFATNTTVTTLSIVASAAAGPEFGLAIDLGYVGLKALPPVPSPTVDEGSFLPQGFLP